MDNEDKKQQLRDTSYLADQELIRIRAVIKAEVDAYEAQVKARFADQVNAQKEIIQNARVELEAIESQEREKVAEINAGNPLCGQIAEEIRSRFGGREKPTGVLGVVEVFRSGDKFPANQVIGVPDVGDLVVRVLKKDGTRSIKCEVCRETELGVYQLPWSWRKKQVKKTTGK
jgi:hypothetical protein